MDDLVGELDRVAAAIRFSGVVRVDRDGHAPFERVHGFAHRALQVANTMETQFAIASGVKGLTAMTVVSLVVDGKLSLSTTARSVLGSDLPLIDDRVTVEHLLAHRSGIGDYLDESLGFDLADYLMPVPVQHLATTEQYLTVLGGHEMKFEPDSQFSYCNGGYVVLALIAERVSGVPFHELVDERVCAPAGMADTAFLRSDDLPARAALGYIEVDGATRTNVFHLPVRGNGDGGIYTTAADVRSMWLAFFEGRILPSEWVDKMVAPRSESERLRYGLGLWLDERSDAVMLQGCDAGVSFCTWHHPSTGTTHTVIANDADGAWPMSRRLRELVAP